MEPSKVNNAASSQTRKEEIDGVVRVCFSPKVRDGMFNRFFNKFKNPTLDFDEAFQLAVVQLLEHLHRNPDKHFDNNSHIASYLWTGVLNNCLDPQITSINRSTKPMSAFIQPDQGEDEYDPIEVLSAVPPDDIFHEELPYDERKYHQALDFLRQLTPKQQQIIELYIALGDRQLVADELGMTRMQVSGAIGVIQRACTQAAAGTGLVEDYDCARSKAKAIAQRKAAIVEKMTAKQAAREAKRVAKVAAKQQMAADKAHWALRKLEIAEAKARYAALKNARKALRS